MSRTSAPVAYFLALCLATGGWAQAEDAKPKAADDALKARPVFSHIITLPASDDLEGKLEAAPDYLKSGDWRSATRLLQAVLEHPEDCFVPVRRTAPGGKETVGWVSARTEANRLLGTLPPAGREVYEVANGSTAAAALARARKRGDLLEVAHVAQRYRYTAAGREAADLLATHHLDRGLYATAARSFAQLLERPDAEKLSPLTLFKAGVAFHRAGDAAGAERAWKLLSARAPGGLAVGGRKLPLAELKKELDRAVQVAAQRSGVVEWTLFRGDAGRSATSAGAIAALRPGWKEETAHHPQVKQWVTAALDQQKTRDTHILPAFYPLAAGDRIIYRSHRGLHALDRASGKLLWDSAFGGTSLDDLAGDPTTMAHLASWATSYLASFPHVLVENSTLGALSADRERVYAVEDLGVPPYPKNYAGFAGRAGAGLKLSYAEEVSDAVYHSKLVALELDGGKALWGVGGRGDKKAAPLNDAYFLGPPLPLGGKLYTLIEQGQALRLVCLEPHDGRLSWMQTLATPKTGLLLDGARRTWAAHPAHSEGVLVCPTNAGAVIAVDVASRGLLWAHSYRDEKPPAEPPVMRPGGRVKMPRRFGVVAPAIRMEVKWKLCAPVIHGGKVLLASPDGATLDCVDLWTGALQWREQRQAADLYLAGVFGDRVLVIGRESARLLRLDGSPLGTVETGPPTGQGVAVGKVYYLPVRTDPTTRAPAIVGIDTEKGTVVSRTALPGDEAPGNLVLSEGDVISQTATQIARYPRAAEKQGGEK